MPRPINRISLLAFLSLVVGVWAFIAAVVLAVDAIYWGPRLLLVAALWAAIAAALLGGFMVLRRRR